MLDIREFSTVKGSSARTFGLFFAALLMGVALWPLLSGQRLRWLPAIMGGVLAALAFLRPVWLEPFNRGWMKVGLALGFVMTPVVMGLIFVLTIIPVGLILRFTGKDPMARGFDPEAPSYWREHAGSGSMKRQF
jgi:Saxitoxin biosynthesis operon protein SxtJ